MIIKRKDNKKNASYFQALGVPLVMSALCFFEQVLPRTFWVELLNFPCICIWRGSGITSVHPIDENGTEKSRFTPQDSHSQIWNQVTEESFSSLTIGHIPSLSLKEFGCMALVASTWGRTFQSCTVCPCLCKPGEPPYSPSPQPLTELLKSLKCKVFYCEISAAVSVIWRVILYGTARALTVIYFRIMRHQFSVKRLFKNTPNLMGCADKLVHSTQLLPFMLVVRQVLCLLSLRYSLSF